MESEFLRNQPRWLPDLVSLLTAFGMSESARFSGMRRAALMQIDAENHQGCELQDGRLPVGEYSLQERAGANELPVA